jgi:hypothetical protein
MKSIRNVKIRSVSFILVFLLLILLPTLVWALSDLYIGVSTKISICGNFIIEGGEDCEGADLDGQTCQSQGYGPGSLSCDIACTFDFYDCSPAPSPTPTPLPTPTLTPTPTLVPILVPTTTDSVSLMTSTTSLPSATSGIVSPTLVPTPSLPQSISFFDINGDGKIYLSELYPTIKKWVDEWRKGLVGGNDYERNIGCDINRDKRCDVVDFSILMSYVDR